MIRPNDRDFDWHDPEVVAVAEQHAIAVYLNDRGEIVLRQHDWPDDDGVILVARQNAGAVVDAILALIEEEQAGEAAPKDRTAADRQRGRRRKHRDSAVTVTVGDRDAPLLPLQAEGK